MPRLAATALPRLSQRLRSPSIQSSPTQVGQPIPDPVTPRLPRCLPLLPRVSSRSTAVLFSPVHVLARLARRFSPDHSAPVHPSPRRAGSLPPDLSASDQSRSFQSGPGTSFPRLVYAASAIRSSLDSERSRSSKSSTWLSTPSAIAIPRARSSAATTRANSAVSARAANSASVCSRGSAT